MSTFKPAWWLNNRHLQTIYPALFRKNSESKGKWRERFITPDNDFFDVDWSGDSSHPIAILIHGLSGSSSSGYITGLEQSLTKQGFRTAALNFRGCSGESNNLARCYHSGETEDIHFLYQSIKQREPETSIAVVGFSLGGNVLLKWLGEQTDKVSLFAAVAVSVPLVLSICATKLDSGLSKIYRHSLISELKEYLAIKHSHLHSIGQLEELDKLTELGDLSQVKSFWQYDDRVVAPLHGYKDVHDYYEKSSSRQFLRHIANPTLLIQAKDDPFMTSQVIPNRHETSSLVELEITEGGGHVGFVSGNNPFKPDYWLDNRISQYLKQQLIE